MAFEFLSNLDTTTMFLLLIIFILFVISMKKIFSIIMSGVWVAVASLLFPIIMNKLGWNIPTDVDSLISFVLLGLGLYFIYLMAKAVYKILSIGEKMVKKSLPEKKKGKKEDKEDKRDREMKKESKEKEKGITKHERNARFYSAIHQKRPAGIREKDYFVIKDEPQEKRPQKSHVTPLPVIKHKKKK